jgi:hypothetical protein
MFDNTHNSSDNYSQGDQIGRIFAQRAIVYYGQVFDNNIISPYFCALFLMSIDYVLLIFTKNGFDYVWAIFSFGHPDYSATMIIFTCVMKCTQV